MASSHLFIISVRWEKAAVSSSACFGELLDCVSLSFDDFSFWLLVLADIWDNLEFPYSF